MILAIASHGAPVRRAPTPGLAEEAGVQFVGYRHGSYYCESRECAAYYNCGYYKRCRSYYQYYDCAPYYGGGGYYYKNTITAAVAAVTSPFAIPALHLAGGLGRPHRFQTADRAVALAQ
jgi:hypothetical protein